MTILKGLAILFVVALAAVLIDCGFLYHQAVTGRKLPFKFSLFPRVTGDLI